MRYLTWAPRYWGRHIPRVLTVPGVKHVCDEVVNEGDLGFGDAAGISVKNWHHHRQVPLLLFVCLQGRKCQNCETPGPGSMPTRSIPSTRASSGSPESSWEKPVTAPAKAPGPSTTCHVVPKGTTPPTSLAPEASCRSSCGCCAGFLQCRAYQSAQPSPTCGRVRGLSQGRSGSEK